MNITLHGTIALIAAFLACAGVSTILCGISDWLADRFTADVRHLRVHRRQVRPGARIPLPGGQVVYVSEVWRDERAGDMVLAYRYDSPEDDDGHEPEWLPAADLVKDAA